MMKLVPFGSRSRSKFASSFIGLFAFFLNLVWTASTNCLSFSRFFQTLERFRIPRHVVPSRVTVYKAGRTPVHERIVNGSSDPHRERTSLSMRERDSDRTQKGCTAEHKMMACVFSASGMMCSAMKRSSAAKPSRSPSGSSGSGRTRVQQRIMDGSRLITIFGCCLSKNIPSILSIAEGSRAIKSACFEERKSSFLIPALESSTSSTILYMVLALIVGRSSSSGSASCASLSLAIHLAKASLPGSESFVLPTNSISGIEKVLSFSSVSTPAFITNFTASSLDKSAALSVSRNALLFSSAVLVSVVSFFLLPPPSPLLPPPSPSPLPPSSSLPPSPPPPSPSPPLPMPFPSIASAIFVSSVTVAFSPAFATLAASVAFSTFTTHPTVTSSATCPASACFAVAVVSAASAAAASTFELLFATFISAACCCTATSIAVVASAFA
mmetsp:Transcript_6137/g.14346  ORF Transcript_6137/g.14346 Transcript_6137/m.14346 type:complete len:441 (+) Transcript_6137:2680-4002(+)